MTPGNKIRRGESKYCTGFMDTNRMWFFHVDLWRLTCALEVYWYYGSRKVNFFGIHYKLFANQRMVLALHAKVRMRNQKWFSVAVQNYIQTCMDLPLCVVIILIFSGILMKRREHVFQWQWIDFHLSLMIMSWLISASQGRNRTLLGSTEKNKKLFWGFGGIVKKCCMFHYFFFFKFGHP